MKLKRDFGVDAGACGANDAQDDDDDERRDDV
jgi:hypothetical protein